MFDLPLRLVAAYGLMALIALAIAAFVWSRMPSTLRRRAARDRLRQDAYYRQRAEAAKADAPDL